MKTVVFSHIADLDGVSCAVLLYKWLEFQGHEIKVVFSDYDELKSLICEHSPGADAVFVSDLSMRDETIMDCLQHLGKHNLFLFDHHASSSSCFEAWKDQATISLDITGKKCAADLVYDFIMANGMPYSADLEHLKDSAHSHDLWIRDVEDGEQLTSVIAIMGAEKAFDALVKDLSLVYHENFPIGFQKCVEVTNERREQAKSVANSTKFIAPVDDKSVVIAAYTTGYQSDVGDMLLHDHSLAWVVLIDIVRGSTSYRTNGYTIQKYGLGVNKLAEHFGGGGHPMASGSPIHPEVAQKGTRQFAAEMADLVKTLIQ